MSKIYFFGYGAYRIKERVAQILGHTPEGGYGAVLEGYVLGIQSLEQIPNQAQDILKKAWGDNFRCYTLKPGKGVIAGVIWEIDEKDLEIIKEWEFVGVWREFITAPVKLKDGRVITNAITEKAPDGVPIKEIVDGLNYEDNLNKEGMKDITADDEYKIKEISKIMKELEEISLKDFH